jgi:hypothetical protein
MPARRTTRVRWIAPPLGALAMACAACGHPATRDDCELIFQRSAEIELRAQAIADPALIANRTAAARASRGQELIDRCVGRRITDDAVACVRAATTADQMDRCLQ